MRTISTRRGYDPRPDTPSAGIARITPLERLIKNHPAGAIFDLDIVDSSAQEVTLKLALRNHDSTDARAALGCIVDCAARLAAQMAIGTCDLAEYEMNIHSGFSGEELSGEELIARASIDSTTPGYATFHCTIHGNDPQVPTLIGESQGTLLRRHTEKPARQQSITDEIACGQIEGL